MKKIAVAAMLAFAAVAHAQVLTFLVTQWHEGGNQMCRYDNGTVLNVGIKLCPLSLRVG